VPLAVEESEKENETTFLPGVASLQRLHEFASAIESEKPSPYQSQKLLKYPGSDMVSKSRIIHKPMT
jgi:hypothetical protein